MKKIKFILISLISVCSVYAEQNQTAESNSTKPPIVEFIDSNLLSQTGSYIDRKKEYIALYFFADWCVASRQMTSNVLQFEQLFGDKVCIVAVNAGSNDRWFFGRYRMPWRTVTPPSRGDLIEYFNVTHVPKFILLNKQGESIKGDRFKREIAYNEQR
jgi:thiol-disulfide isomerase/thioredoxin